MTSTIAEKIAVMQAFEDGKTIEARSRRETEALWKRLNFPAWDWIGYDYRVAVTKPEPKHVVRYVLLLADGSAAMASEPFSHPIPVSHIIGRARVELVEGQFDD